MSLFFAIKKQYLPLLYKDWWRQLPIAYYNSLCTRCASSLCSVARTSISLEPSSVFVLAALWMGRGLLLFRYSTLSKSQNTIPIYSPSILVLNFTHLGWSYYPYTLSPGKPSIFTFNSNLLKTSYLSSRFCTHPCLPSYNLSPTLFVNRILISCRCLYTSPLP